jgi:hypothetical protein
LLNDMPDEGLTLIVCGGRDYADSRAIYWALDQVRAKRGVRLIRHGGARGADAIAGDWAKQAGVPVEVYEADWEMHGKAAGPVRNQAMADAGADGCIAFPGGRGTADMIRRALAAGIKVWEPEKEKTPATRAGV